MAKKVDKKNQERVTLDMILESMNQNGIISAGNLKKKWQSLKGLIKPKRLVFFLQEKGIKLSLAAVDFLHTVKKSLSVALKNRPELIAT